MTCARVASSLLRPIQLDDYHKRFMLCRSVFERALPEQRLVYRRRRRLCVPMPGGIRRSKLRKQYVNFVTIKIYNYAHFFLEICVAVWQLLNLLVVYLGQSMFGGIPTLPTIILYQWRPTVLFMFIMFSLCISLCTGGFMCIFGGGGVCPLVCYFYVLIYYCDVGVSMP